MYYSPQSKESISLEVAVETKLFPDSALGNSLCNSEYKTKSEKKPKVFLASHAPKLSYCPQGDPTGFLVCPGTLKRFKTTPNQLNEPLF